ncbi:MAG: DUF4256 domain-containing protein [Pirellulaceae bacterium]
MASGSGLNIMKYDVNSLLLVIKSRFEQNGRRHSGVAWQQVEKRLLDRPEALRSLQAMEATGGEPDVVGVNDATGAIIFCDCSPESPAGRRSLCYDRAALDSRKANKPRGSALEMAAEMGVALMTEEQYRYLQTLGNFDTKTSSWVVTPEDVRSLKGALFCDRRFGRVFVYHNGAESYYAARGFRGWLEV